MQIIVIYLLEARSKKAAKDPFLENDLKTSCGVNELPVIAKHHPGKKLKKNLLCVVRVARVAQ
jgi:hypothetical protein